MSWKWCHNEQLYQDFEQLLNTQLFRELHNHFTHYLKPLNVRSG